MRLAAGLREAFGRLAGGSLEARRSLGGRLAGAWLRMNIRV